MIMIKLNHNINEIPDTNKNVSFTAAQKGVRIRFTKFELLHGLLSVTKT